MKTTSVRELRNNFAKVSRWMEAGEKVEITKCGLPYARMELLERPVKKQKHVSAMTLKERRAFFRKHWIEHTKWMKETYGDKVLKGNGVLLMREGAQW